MKKLGIPIVIPDEATYGGRDPVSSKVLLFLDSGQSLRDFRNDRCCASTIINIRFYSTVLGIIALEILNGEGTDKLLKKTSIKAAIFAILPLRTYKVSKKTSRGGAGKVLEYVILRSGRRRRIS